MFLQEKLMQTGKMLIHTKDPIEERLLLNSMIRDAFSSLLAHIPTKNPSKTDLIGQFKRVNVTWGLVIKELESLGDSPLKPGGFRDFVEAQEEFKSLKGKL